MSKKNPSYFLKFRSLSLYTYIYIFQIERKIYRLSHQAACLLTYSWQGDNVNYIAQIKQILENLKIKYGNHAAFSDSNDIPRVSPTIYAPHPL